MTPSVRDGGVFYAERDEPRAALIRVESNPAEGQYSFEEETGRYTFCALDIHKKKMVACRLDLHQAIGDPVPTVTHFSFTPIDFCDEALRNQSTSTGSA